LCSSAPGPACGSPWGGRRGFALRPSRRSARPARACTCFQAAPVCALGWRFRWSGVHGRSARDTFVDQGCRRRCRRPRRHRPLPSFGIAGGPPDERLTNQLDPGTQPHVRWCGIPSTWRSPTTRRPGGSPRRHATSPQSALPAGRRVVALGEVDGMPHLPLPPTGRPRRSGTSRRPAARRGHTVCAWNATCPSAALCWREEGRGWTLGIDVR